MDWSMNKNRPICPQLCELLCVAIAKGEFLPGARLPSVRELALTAGINPNTVQKSFSELENLGLIYSVKGTGWFVGENTAAAKETVEKLAAQKTAEFLAEMKKLGIDAEGVNKYVKGDNV